MVYVEVLHIEIKLFARLRELCGRNELTLELPEGADVDACFRELAGQYPAIAEMRDRLMVAVNEEYADWQRALRDGDVLTFIPPVSGGQEGSQCLRHSFD